MMRGHLKVLVMKALEEGEKSGYGLMKFLEQKVGSKPSSGSMYPILEGLRKESIVGVKEEGKRKVYSLTAEGKRLAKKIGTETEEILDRCVEGFKMMHAITGEDMSGCEMVVQQVRKGEMPLKGLNPELAEFRQLMLQIYGQNDRKKMGELRKILKEGMQRMRKMK